MPASEQDESAVADPARAVHGVRHIPALRDGDLRAMTERGESFLVWFTAAWCGPCAQMAPHLDEFSVTAGEAVRVVAVDEDVDEDAHRRYQVASYPTFILFWRGVRVWQRAGVYEDSAADLAHTLIPLFDRAAALHTSQSSAWLDRGPVPPPARGSRALIVPALPPGAECRIARPGSASRARPASPGVHELEAGAEVLLHLAADHRHDPAIDLDAILLFEPDSIDQLVINGVPVAPEEFLDYPALSRMHALTIYAGSARPLDGADAAALDRLDRLDTFDVGARIGLPDLVVDGGWALADLRQVAPVNGHDATGELDEDVLPSADESLGVAQAATGLSAALFVVGSMPGTTSLTRSIADIARRHADTPVAVIDVRRRESLAERFEIALVPTLRLAIDGNEVWRRVLDAGEDSSADPSRLTAQVTRAIDAARSGRVRRVRAGVDPRPSRTLRLSPGALPFELGLQPPGLGELAVTEIVQGGDIDVPAGWDVLVQIHLGAEDHGFDWESMERFHEHDVDTIGYFSDSEEGLPIGLARTVRRLSGLRHLAIHASRASETADDLLAALRTLSHLRSIEITDGYYGDDGDQMAALVREIHAMLPDVIINGNWSGLIDA